MVIHQREMYRFVILELQVNKFVCSSSCSALLAIETQSANFPTVLIWRQLDIGWGILTPVENPLEIVRTGDFAPAGCFDAYPIEPLRLPGVAVSVLTDVVEATALLPYDTEARGRSTSASVFSALTGDAMSVLSSFVLLFLRFREARATGRPIDPPSADQICSGAAQSDSRTSLPLQDIVRRGFKGNVKGLASARVNVERYC